MRRYALACLALAVTAAAVAAGCGRNGKVPPATTTLPTVEPAVGPLAKTADSLVQAAVRVLAAKAQGAAPAEVAALSDSIVHVREDGAVEVTIHAAEPLTAAQLAELRQLGVDVGAPATTPAAPGQPPGGVLDAWVPAERLPAVNGLAWIASITAPSYGINDT